VLCPIITVPFYREPNPLARLKKHLEEGLRLFKILVITAADLEAGIVQDPVAAMIPGPEIGVGQSRFRRALELPGIMAVMPGDMCGQRDDRNHDFSLMINLNFF
jgi:hypothetical protein